MTRGGLKRGLLLALCLFFVGLFGGLGVWQIERRTWKLDLIARIEARVDAPPVALPPPAEWARFNSAAAEYRRVRVQGRLVHDRETRVDALTELGAGNWLLTPLRTRDGLVLINRGFIPKGGAAVARPRGVVTVTGLLRPSEPEGRVLRPNRPAEDRWYSRDIAAIAKRRGLGPVAPFFIDAAAAASPGAPVGGLTVIAFRNNHLIYALTWFALAALSLGGLVLVARARHEDG